MRGSLQRSLGGLVAVFAALALSFAWASSASAGTVRPPGPTGPSPFATSFDAPLGRGNVVSHGGPTLKSPTVYSIYWEPTGYTFSTYGVIGGYLSSLTADAGAPTNALGVLSQYKISPKITDWGSAFDVSPFPSADGDCAGVAAQPCLDPGQLAVEVELERENLGWPSGTGSLFLIFTPPGVNDCIGDGSDTVCSLDANSCLSYHGSITVGKSVSYYAVIPTLGSFCHSTNGSDIQPEPNGAADVEIDAVEQNLVGAISDPTGRGWYDSAGYEIGDKCRFSYGQALEGTPSANQLINTGQYWTSTAYSNAARACYQTGPPLVRTMTPAAQVGGAVTITGANLSDATVSIGGAAATVTGETDGEISATFPAGVTSGKVKITDAFGTTTTSSSMSLLPTLDSFGPADGHTGSTVTVAGSSFGSVTQVKVGGVAALFKKSATSLSVTIPKLAVTGPIQAGPSVELLAAPGGDFVVDPTIASFSPLSAPAGAKVTLNGSGFGAAAETRVVTVGGAAATGVTWVSPTQVRFVVPVGASTGTVSIAVSGGSPASSVADLKVPPSVSGFDDATYKAGDPVTISGNGLAGASAVSIGSVPVTDFTPAEDGESISAVVPAGALTGAVSVVTPGGTAKGPVLDVVPTLDALPVGEGAVGSVLMLDGATFTGTKAVTVGGAKAAFKVMSPTSLRVTVPADAVSGSVGVTNAGGTTLSSDPFVVDPEIVSFKPASAGAGAVVTITGSGLGGAAESRTVEVDGVTATSVTWVSPNSVRFIVPVGARTGVVSIATASSPTTATSAAQLTVPPDVTGFDQSTYHAGDAVVVEGNNLEGASAVEFGSVAAGSFTVADDGDSISTTVPPTAVTGVVKVTTPSGVATGPAIHVIPTIDSFSPEEAGAGATVTFTGNTFTGTTAVVFGGAKASFKIVSATTLTAVVPAGATTAHISMTNAGGTEVSAGTFTPDPTIASFTPASGAPGSTLTLSGTGLADVTHVVFRTTTGTVSVTPASVGASSLHVIVPSTAADGQVEVNTAGGQSTTSKNAFTLTFAVSSFTPTTAMAGSHVTITGVGFTGATAVEFDGQPATGFTVESATSIDAIVPQSQVSGQISIVKGKSTATSASSFTAFVFTGTDPANPLPSETIHILGTGFDSVTGVSFYNGSTYSEPFAVDSDTELTTTMPSAAKSFWIVNLASPNGTLVDSVSMAYISSTTPTDAAVGASVTIAGNGFTGATGVSFNGIPASFAVNANSRITATVPTGATTGPIQVTRSDGTFQSLGSFIVDARFELNEIAPGTSPGPIVELRALTSGSASTTMLTDASDSVALFSSLPDITVQAGDLVVVHFGSPSGVTTETSSESQCSDAACYPQAWDVVESTTFSTADKVLGLLSGGAVDALAAVRDASAPGSSYITALEQYSSHNDWTSCPNACGPADAVSISANWGNAGTTPGGYTLQRDYPAGDGADTNGPSDWSIQLSTLGSPNSP